MRLKSLVATTALAAVASLGFGLGAANAQAKPIVCLITKTDINPFFVKMKEGAQAAADKNGMELRAFAGKVDGDNETQVSAIESCTVAGAKGILITPSDSQGIVPAVEAARKAGLLVIALDTPLDPANAADATFATDNFKAGQLIGEWAKATLGDKAKDAKIAFLDLTPAAPTVDVLRDQGFMKGFGIDTADPKRIGDENDPRIVGHDVTNGNEEGGRTAMENLLQREPGINVVYTINEPAAAGAYEAIKAANAKDVLVVSIDGGCAGIANVKEGVIGATSMQYPLKMAALGVEAVKKFAETGEKPKATAGLDFTDTGADLVTDKPVDGVQSMTSEKAKSACWG